MGQLGLSRVRRSLPTLLQEEESGDFFDAITAVQAKEAYEAALIVNEFREHFGKQKKKCIRTLGCGFFICREIT
jgi:hypothetical protein